MRYQHGLRPTKSIGSRIAALRVLEANIRQRRDETRALLEQAKVATTAGYAGANRWVEHQERTLIRFDKLCEILDDPNVPLGSVIQPSGIVPASRLEQAGRQRALQGAAVSLIDFAPADDEVGA